MTAKADPRRRSAAPVPPENGGLTDSMEQRTKLKGETLKRLVSEQSIRRIPDQSSGQTGIR